MNILNLTPHAVHIVDDAHNVVHTFAPSGDVARINLGHQSLDDTDGGNPFPFPVHTRLVGGVVGMPADWVTADAVIVSAQVADAVKALLIHGVDGLHQPAVFTVGPVIRKADGSPIGVKHLVLN